RCPVCSRTPDGVESSTGEDVAILEPCGHEIPNAQFVDLYGKSDADPFVLADMESKRRIMTEIVDLIDSMDAQLESEFGTGSSDRADESEKILRLLAAPFSG